MGDLAPVAVVVSSTHYNYNLVQRYIYISYKNNFSAFKTTESKLLNFRIAYFVMLFLTMLWVSGCTLDIVCCLLDMYRYTRTESDFLVNRHQ